MSTMENDTIMPQRATSKSPSTLAEAAERLFGAAAQRCPCAPIRDLLGSDDLDAAYAVQTINTERALAAGRRLVGRKIGLTSPAVQRQLGVSRPDFGMLFADMAVGEGMPISPDRILQPRIEAEIALILDRDLTQEQPTPADVISAIAYVVPALEIVDSRIRDWDISIADTIADNASSGLFVLGSPARRIDGIDLRGAGMVMRRGGALVSEGAGSACLGSPLNAAVWLAGEMGRRGHPLRAGDIVLTGALGPVVPVMPGDRFEAEIQGIGRVSADFASEA